jgi:hypothetical protein
MRYAVEPFDLAGSRSCPHAAFARLDDMIDWRSQTIAGDSSAWAILYRDFLAHLRNKLPAERFADLQRKWLRPGSIGANPEMLKFFDVLWWFEGKLRLCRRLSLDKAKPRSIIDVGAGPSHFGYLARYLGHAVLATDLPFTAIGDPVLAMYDDFRALFEIDCAYHVTTKTSPLPPSDSPPELVTALLTKFHVTRDGAAWSVDDWRTFLTNLRPLIANTGSVFFQLNEVHISVESWSYLVELSDYSQIAGRQIRLGSKYLSARTLIGPENASGGRENMGPTSPVKA